MFKFILSERKPFITGLIQIFIIINIVIIITIISQVEALANTIYVPDNYSTIQAAVDAASAGDTILVYKSYTDVGTKESVTITKSNLTIKAAESGVIVSPPDNPKSGFLLSSVNGVTIEGFTVQDARYGIYLESSSNNNITNNTANSNSDGICLKDSSDNTLVNNTANSNLGFGIDLDSSSNNILTNNTANSNGFIADLGNGISLKHSSSNNILTNNTANSNLYAGIWLRDSSNNTLENNTANSNWWGINLWYSSNDNKLTNNTANSNYHGISIFSSSNNNILANNIANLNYEDGIYLEYSSNDNKLTNNTANSNEYGIRLNSSNNNVIYFNSFVNNAENVRYSGDLINTWNSPELITYTYNGKTYINYTGNYWSNYTGSDADGDGIGDTPYSIDGDQDSYPLMIPFENYSSTEDNPPTIEIISPSDGDTVSGTVRFSSYSTDDYGMDKVEFYIDNELKVSHGPFGPDTVASTCNWDCDTTPGSIDYIPNGNHTFKAKAYDTAGQTNVDTISFIVDNIVENQPPYVQITSGPSGTIDYNDVTFTWSGDDPDGQITGYYYELDNPTPNTWTTETTHTFNNVSEGNHTFYVQAKDNEGATSPVISRSFTYTPTISTSDISLEEVEISKYIQLMSLYNPNNISVKVKFKNIGEVIINSFQIELYINGELKHVEKVDNKNLTPETSGNSLFFWTLSEDICGDNIKMEIKITDVNPAESNVNTENNSKTKILAIYYVPFNIKEETYSFENPGFNDWWKLKSTLDNLLNHPIRGPLLWFLAKVFKAEGLCLGMASTVVAYKEGSLPIPNGGSVNDLDLAMTEVRNNIIAYQLNPSNLGIYVHRIYDRKMYNFPVIPAEYQKIIDFIGKENLIMLDLGKSGEFGGGHQLVAYQCITDKEIGTAFIYVYDSNCPESEEILELPLNTGIFSYDGYDYDMVWAEDLKPLPTDLIEEYFNDLANLIYDGLKSAGQELINIFSSVDTLITDEYGRRIGYLDGSPVNEIPDGVMEIFGDFETYQIPLSLNYNIKLRGKEQGVFELHLTKPNPDDTMLNLVYEDVPTENNSEASLTIGPSVTDFTMQLDQNGDGIIDETKNPDFIEGVAVILGDFGSANNGPPDCKVDFEDLMIFAMAYGSTSGDDNWNLICDIAGPDGSLTPDGVIDFEDLMIFAMQYGKTCADQ